MIGRDPRSGVSSHQDRNEVMKLSDTSSMQLFINNLMQVVVYVLRTLRTSYIMPIRIQNHALGSPLQTAHLDYTKFVLVQYLVR